MSRTGSRSPATVAASIAAVVVLATGCQDASEDGGDKGTADPDSAAWTTSTDPVEAGGLAWASGSVVHLSDGTTVDVGGPVTTYVVAGDGVYFTPADSEGTATEHGNMTTGRLLFADRDGEVTETGTTVYVESLGSSPDGRYLGFIDATSGQKDSFSDYPQGTAVVVDLSTGSRVVDTTDGMGDIDEDDLAHDYPEVYLRVHFPDASSALVEGLGDFVYTLPAGDGQPNDTGVRSPTDPTSPDGGHTIEDRGFQDRVVATSGDVVRLRTGAPRWDLRWWLDADTVVGIAIDGPGEGTDLGPDNSSSLLTCEVPEGSCSEVEGTTGQAIRFPVGAGDEALDLGPREDAS